MTTNTNRWLLPDGVDETLPPRADRLEALRREVLDLYRSWGYDLIKTPLIEFLDSLLIVPGQELQLSTFKIVDQLSGKSMGVRADISSQAARIDAHLLQKDGPVRLCYADSVLRTRPNGPLGSRSPQLVGAELYGHAGTESDVEVISLLLETLAIAGIREPLLALGHCRIARILLERAGLPADLERKLFDAMQNKASADIELLLAEASLAPALAECVRQLPTLHGDRQVLEQAAALLGKLDPGIDAALNQLREIDAALQQRYPQQARYFDLCELGGYDYHNGVIFSACANGHGEAIAKGGRYDNIGAAFGRARPATGFDADLKTLLNLGQRDYASPARIYAPADADPLLQETVSRLRQQGEVVVQGFRTNGEAADEARNMDCTQLLRRQQDGHWLVTTLDH